MDQLILFLEIILINIVLSGDNAVVIAMASKNLSLEQRKMAVWWGAFGAVCLRLLLTVIAVFLLKIPFIQVLGSFLLLYIAIKLLIEDDSHSKVKAASSLISAIWTIVVADFVMSLDNVLAIAAVAEGDYVIIILGIALSIPIIVWGSTIVMNMLNRYPILVYLGAGILGYTAGEMFMNDIKMQQYLGEAYPFLGWLAPVAGTVIVLMIGIIKRIKNTPKTTLL